jgi:hypothetical protein
MSEQRSAYGRNMVHCDACGDDYENGPGDHNQFCQGSPADNVAELKELVEELERRVEALESDMKGLIGDGK